MDVYDHIDRLVAAQQRFESTIAAMPPSELSTLTVLPGWTRAHILTHLARHADGCRNAFLAARSGEIVRRYVSPAARNADVDLGATRPPEMVIEDFLLRCRHFLVEVQSTPKEMWETEMMNPLYADEGEPRPLSGIVSGRVSEIEIHHVDFGAAYSFADTPRDMLDEYIARYVSMHTAAGMAPCTCVATDSGREWAISGGTGGPTVRGTGPELLKWLAGRQGGGGLVLDGGASLPTLPPS